MRVISGYGDGDEHATSDGDGWGNGFCSVESGLGCGSNHEKSFGYADGTGRGNGPDAPNRGWIRASKHSDDVVVL